MVDMDCSDLGLAVVNSLVLPILRQRLDSEARQHAAATSLKAQEAIIRVEVGISPLQLFLRFNKWLIVHK